MHYTIYDESNSKQKPHITFSMQTYKIVFASQATYKANALLASEHSLMHAALQIPING